MQPYKPKTIDPGRLIYNISFYQQTAVSNDSGGTTVGRTLALSTKAARSEIREGNELALEAGASVLNQDCYYTIRFRKNFYPEKDMDAEVNGKIYTVRAIIPLNEPVNYIKLLCIKKD